MQTVRHHQPVTYHLCSPALGNFMLHFFLFGSLDMHTWGEHHLS